MLFGIGEMILFLIFLIGIIAYFILQNLDYLSTYRWLLRLSLFALLILLIDILLNVYDHIQ